MQLHVAPIFLGAGARLFDGHVATAPGNRAEAGGRVATGVVHLKYELASR